MDKLKTIVKVLDEKLAGGAGAILWICQLTVLFVIIL